MRIVWLWLLVASASACVSAPQQERNPSNITAYPDNRGVLWHIVNNECLPHFQNGKGPAPCDVFKPLGPNSGGYAVLKDIDGATHYLLIASDPLMGIEDPSLLEASAPNFWQAAWENINFVINKTKKSVPRDLLGMGINPPGVRTQNQLHIHMDCLKPGVRERFKKFEKEITTQFAKASKKLLHKWGVAYRVMKIYGENLVDDPFKLLARDALAQQTEMKDHSLMVIGAYLDDGKPGFYIIEATQKSKFTGKEPSGEFLLDRDCKIAKSL